MNPIHILILCCAFLTACATSDDSLTRAPESTSPADIQTSNSNRIAIPSPTLDVAQLQRNLGLNAQQVEQVNELNKETKQQTDSLQALGFTNRRDVDDALKQIELQRESKLETIFTKSQYLKYYRAAR